MTTQNPPNQEAMSSAMMIGIAALGGGTILAVAGLSGFNKGQILILLAAVLLVLVILVVFRLVLKWLAARRSAPFTQTVQRAAGDTPNAISSPGSRAKLDDLRRNFETGLSRFRAAGKDLYKLPWYLLVGEPGSGKTEAIRHSSIPFPPGLQDQLQGSGGTVNMNWWFTNDAVILDTAGRYMFNEVQAGATGEWTEFLRLLLRNRPQCPINGLLLVIPANSLILDTADQIESKGGQIAQQLDRIQRTLEVRFPVYIVVTKCDLVNGFREFFDGLNDPRLQHQILGWSNPAPLDQPFNPELVDEHLKSVAAKLSQRRLGLLLDPVARESEQSRRIDEVDSLYSLPESFLRLGPRLRRYLEMIFVAGEWSPKPLFLRGIYFTSSMREGQAIDAELMELLHVPVESLREGRLWERDRAFFLRDLFLKKVFPEKGLVTRAASTAKLQRTRTFALLGGGFIAAGLLVVFTWFGNTKLRQSIGEQGEFWQSLADQSGDASRSIDLAVIAPVKPPPGAASPATAPAFKSRLDEPLPGGDAKHPRTVGDMYGDLLKYEQSRIYVHPVLLPAAKLLDSGGNLNQQKADDYLSIYKVNVLTPLVNAAGAKLAMQDPAGWTPAATAALAELVRCRAGKAATLDPLLQYVAPDALASDRFHSRYAPSLETGLKLVQPDGKAVIAPPKGAIKAGVDHFIEHWRAQIAQSSVPYQSLADSSGPADSARGALKEMGEVCNKACKSPPQNTAEYVQQLNNWRSAFDRYTSACAAIESGLARLALDDPSAALAAQYKSGFDKSVNQARLEYEALLAEFPATSSAGPDSPTDPSADAAGQRLNDLREKLQRAHDNLSNLANSDLLARLADLDSSILKAGHLPDGKGARSYAIVQRVYRFADDAIPKAETLKGTAPPAPDADAQVKSARAGIDSLAKTLPEDSTTASKNANILLSSLAEPADRYQSVAMALSKAPTSADAVKRGVTELAGSDPAHYPQISFPRTPFVSWPAADPGFNPAPAAAYLESLKPLLSHEPIQPSQGAAEGGCATSTILNASELDAAARGCRQGIAAYLGEYAAFWNSVVNTRPSFNSAQPGNRQNMDWKELRDNLPLAAASVNDGLAQVSELLVKAQQLNDAIKGNVSPADPAAFDRMAAAARTAQASLKADPYSSAFSLWLNLENEPVKARSQVLNTKAAEFARTYTLIEVPDDNFATHYWRSFAMAMLDALTRVQDPDAQFVLNWQIQHHGFPLGPKTSPALRPADLDQLREAIKNVQLPTAPTGKPDDTIIAGGRLPGAAREEIKVLNAQLDKLASGSMRPAQLSEINLLSKFLAALPSSGNPGTCTISIPDFNKQKDLQTRYSPDHPLADVTQWPSGSMQLEINQQLAQGNARLPLNKAGELGQVQYPGDPLGFALFYIPDNTNPDQHLAAPSARNEGFAEPWSSLRLLTGNAHRSPEDHTLFYAELTPSFKNETYSIWIMLKFGSALPEYSSEEWPK
jgi:hypothetical protein